MLLYTWMTVHVTFTCTGTPEGSCCSLYCGGLAFSCSISRRDCPPPLGLANCRPLITAPQVPETLFEAHFPPSFFFPLNIFDYFNWSNFQFIDFSLSSPFSYWVYSVSFQFQILNFSCPNASFFFLFILSMVLLRFSILLFHYFKDDPTSSCCTFIMAV